MFWNRFTKTAAGVSRYLPPGHSECGFPAIVSLCRPKGPVNLVGMLNMSHITRRYYGSPHRTGQCSHWSGVYVCWRKRACDIPQQSTIDTKHPFQKIPFRSMQSSRGAHKRMATSTPAMLFFPVSKVENTFCCAFLCHCVLATLPHPVCTARPQDTLALQALDFRTYSLPCRTRTAPVW